MAARNLFQTTTLKGGLLSLAGVVFLTVVNGSAGIAERYNPGKAQDIKDVVGLLNNLGAIAGISGFGVTALGRYQASDDTYTPDWLPGRNKEDCKNG